MANGQIVMDLLAKAHRELGTTIVLVTHDPDYAQMAERQIVLVDGRLTS